MSHSLTPLASLQITRVVGLPCAMLVLILTLAGCGKSNRDAMILISGDTRGWITPCGCASNQSGGLPRRAGLINARSTEHDLLVLDAGGSAIGTGEYQLIKFTSLLTGLKALGLDAHNVGGAETEFAPSQLRELAKQSGDQVSKRKAWIPRIAVWHCGSEK